MAKIRVHELAKELGMSSKEMVDTLQKLGLDVKNHMSTMEDSQAGWVRKRLGEKTEATPNKVQEKPVSKPAPQTGRPAAQGESRRDINQSTGVGSRNIEKNANIPPAPKPKTTFPSKTPDMKEQGKKFDGQHPDRRTDNRPRTGDRASNMNRPGSTGNQAKGAAAPNDFSRQRDNNRPRPAGAPDYHRNAPRPVSNARPAPGGAPRSTETRPAAPGKITPAKHFAGENKKIVDRKPNQVSRPQNFDEVQSRKINHPYTPGKPVKKGGPAKPQFTKDYSRPQKKGKHKKKKEDLVMQTPDKIMVGESVQVRELAEKLAKSSAEIVKKLMELGIMATINQEIDYETVEILASLYDVEVEHEISQEQQMLEEIIDSEESLIPRSPIVTVMGHVDHGKTSLLDRVRKSDVVSGEAGGITQHIGAYQVNVNGNRITFIDTPGHEAFTAMRARGANLTDIVVLVVAADDGVMPQTIEAINHIKAAKVPFLVALNKMDKPDVNPDKVMQQLTEYNIVAEEWGGDTMFIPVSAKTGMGIDNLLEMVLLLAEMNDIKANPNRAAEGVVIEAELDKGRGPVATLLVQKGTLKVGDCIVCGFTWCKVRAMTDYRGRRVDLAYPSMPVEITGWSDVPEVGEKVQVCEEKIAKEVASLRLNEKKLEDQKHSSKISLDDFFKQMQNSGMKELNLIIKGDVQGSIEALAQSLLRLSTSEVKVNVIHSAVGAVTETDVMLASASNAIIIGFNVRPEVKARKYGEEENIDIRLYRVIYEAIEDVKKAMVGLLDPEYREKYLGRAEVRATFKVPNIGTIGGSYVIDGKLQRNADMRVLRDSVIIYEGKLASLRRFKDDVKEVVEGYECGIGVKDFNDLKEGDIIEAFVMEEIAREL